MPAALPAMLFSASAMSAIVGLRYLMASGIFAWITHRMRPGLYADRAGQIQREIGWSLLSALVYGIPAGIVAWRWQALGDTRIYTDLSAFPLWYLPASVLLYLFAHDTWFYWTHRLMHCPRWFRIAHAVHHDSRPPTAWAAMSFHPWEALTGAIIIPTLLFIVPIHPAALGIVLFIMTLMGITNHLGWEIMPGWIVHGWLGRWIITATHHHRHHEVYRANYGLYFRFWDRLLGTDQGLCIWRDGKDPINAAVAKGAPASFSENPQPNI
jgi:sterol desaturase/sphingolipid hydroxylase (fatty acid hydroxylase superfamily)